MGKYFICVWNEIQNVFFWKWEFEPEWSDEIFVVSNTFFNTTRDFHSIFNLKIYYSPKIGCNTSVKY